MDCIRCGAFLDTDEGICPTCGDVFGRVTAYQMPQLTSDLIAEQNAAKAAEAPIPPVLPSTTDPAPAPEVIPPSAPSSMMTIFIFLGILLVAVALGLGIIFVLLT